MRILLAIIAVVLVALFAADYARERRIEKRYPCWGRVSEPGCDYAKD